MSALTDAHIAAQARLRARAAAAIGTLWGRLPGYDEKDIPVFLAGAVPVTLAAQRQSVAVTNAYLARTLTRRPEPLDTQAIIAATRNGATPEEVYRRPFVTVWTALTAGTQWEDAVAAGLARATSTAEMDVQLAARSTFDVVGRADNAIRGYQRVPDPGACAFCLAVAGAFVKSGDAMPLHNRCGCSLDPILNEVAASPVPEDVAVHDHGELGPVLGDPAHSFTAL